MTILITMDMKSKFSDKVAHLEASAIREIFKLLAKPGIISFAGGAPDPNLFPTKELSEIAAEILLNDGKKVSVGAPYVKGAKVTAVVENTFKDDKVIVFKYKSKKDYHRTIGHRQQYTNIRIKDIKVAKAKEAAPAENAEA